MKKYSWVEEFSGSVVVCGQEGIIIEMNDKALIEYEKWGGKQLLGTNLLDCHSEPSLSKLKQMMEQRRTNIYTIEKKGIKKLIYQTPLVCEGRISRFCGDGH